MKTFFSLVLLMAPGSALKMLLFGALFLCAATSLAEVPLAPLDANPLASIAFLPSLGFGLTSTKSTQVAGADIVM